MNREFKKDFLIDLSFVLVISLIIYFSFKFVFIYLFPFIIGLLITALVQKPAEYISRKIKIKKGACALILVVLTYILLVGIIFFCGYRIVGAVTMLYNGFADNINYFEKMFESINQKLSRVINTFPDDMKTSFSNAFTNLLGSLAEKITSFVSSVATSAASYAPGVLVSVVVTIVASCYIAKDFDTVKRFATGLISDKIRNLLVRVKEITVNKIFKIIKGYLIIMVITFVELAIGFLLLKINNAILIALLIAVLDLLPVLGTGTILIPWGIINLILGNYWLGAALLIIYVVVLLIRNIIEPKVISHQVGLHPLITLLCIFIGLKLFGFLGMLLLPLAVVLVYNLCFEGEIFLFRFKKLKNKE